MPLNPAWKSAFDAATAFNAEPRKIEELENHWSALDEVARRRAHRLLIAWVRERGRIHHAMQPFLRKPPRLALRTLLELAGTEIALAAPDRHPAIVHHAVDATKRLLSAREAGMVNAVLRRVAETLPTVGIESSHPSWLVQRWKQQFGDAETAKLLAWNQQEATLFVRWARKDPPPEGTQPTEWAHFFRVAPGALGTVLPFVARGEAYVQDPFSQYPVAMALAHQPRTVLDLCAAPGGKSRAILDAANNLPTLVAVDLPGPRLERLRENLANVSAPERVAVLGADVCGLNPDQLRAAGHPPVFDAVVLDVPCSNTGVIGRRPDVRWLLSPRQIDELVPLQARLLDAAAALVAPGGYPGLQHLQSRGRRERGTG